MSVPCELQEDGEATCDLEAGVGVLEDANVSRLDDVFDGLVRRLLLVALGGSGLEEGHRVGGCRDEGNARHSASRPFRFWCRR